MSFLNKPMRQHVIDCAVLNVMSRSDLCEQTLLRLASFLPARSDIPITWLAPIYRQAIDEVRKEFKRLMSVDPHSDYAWAKASTRVPPKRENMIGTGHSW